VSSRVIAARSRAPAAPIPVALFLLLGLAATPALAQAPPGLPPGPPPGLPEPPAEPPEFPTPLSSWELEAHLFGSLYGIHPTVPGASFPIPDVNGNRASGSLELTRFLTPVADDDAPRSLQPFLQRTSEISGTFGGSGFVTRNPDGGTDRTDSHLTLGLGANLYLTPYVALTAAASYDYDVLHDIGVDQTTHAFAASTGLGFRFHDVRFDLVAGFIANDVNGSFAPIRLGVAQVSMYAVLARCFSVNLWAGAIQSGGVGGADLVYYPTQNLGFYLSGYGERGELYYDPTLLNRFGGDVGLSYWVTPRMRLAMFYDLTDNDMPVQGVGSQVFGSVEIEHALSVYGSLRLP
jgi:hypothetical protein